MVLKGQRPSGMRRDEQRRYFRSPGYLHRYTPQLGIDEYRGEYARENGDSLRTGARKCLQTTDIDFNVPVP